MRHIYTVSQVLDSSSLMIRWAVRVAWTEARRKGYVLAKNMKIGRWVRRLEYCIKTEFREIRHTGMHLIYQAQDVNR